MKESSSTGPTLARSNTKAGGSFFERNKSARSSYGECSYAQTHKGHRKLVGTGIAIIRVGLDRLLGILVALHDVELLVDLAVLLRASPSLVVWLPGAAENVRG
jgi:hypothetical protein